MFDAMAWAASILGCGRQEADERVKRAFADDPSIGRYFDETHGLPQGSVAGSMKSLQRKAAFGDAEAVKSLREINMMFVACDRARDTGQPCKKCGPVVTVFNAGVYVPAEL